MPRREEYWSNPEKCKQATLEWQRSHPAQYREQQKRFYEKHPEKRQEYQKRFYEKHPEKRQEYKDRYKGRYKGRYNYSEYRRKYYLKNRKWELERDRIERLARNNVALESECEICGSREKLEHHHPDYSKPLETQTLCKRCHSRLHRKQEGRFHV